MYPQQVHNYLESFFGETDCQIIDNQPHYMTVQLTIDIDKKIMNRPFYWKYVESTNAEPNPSQITLITDGRNVETRGEIIHFGSPRLTQIFKTNKILGAFVQMYENVEKRENLIPWLGINYKVSYQCDRTKETLYSFGMNLLTGTIIEDFQERLNQVELVTEAKLGVFCLPWIIKPIRAMERLETNIEQLIQQDDHSWAEEAKEKWKKELQILDYFYEDEEEKPERYEIEKQAIEERYTPHIKMEIINGGLFYLR